VTTGRGRRIAAVLNKLRGLGHMSTAAQKIPGRAILAARLQEPRFSALTSIYSRISNMHPYRLWLTPVGAWIYAIFPCDWPEEMPSRGPRRPAHGLTLAR